MPDKFDVSFFVDDRNGLWVGDVASQGACGTGRTILEALHSVLIKMGMSNACSDCGATERLHDHHVVPASLGGRFTVTICHECHEKAHTGGNPEKWMLAQVAKATSGAARLGAELRRARSDADCARAGQAAWERQNSELRLELLAASELVAELSGLRGETADSMARSRIRMRRADNERGKRSMVEKLERLAREYADPTTEAAAGANGEKAGPGKTKDRIAEQKRRLAELEASHRRLNKAYKFALSITGMTDMEARRASGAYTVVEKTPGVCGGRACVIGTRIPVWIIESLYRNGASKDDIQRNYPQVDAWTIDRVIDWARQNKKEIDRDIAENEDA